MSVDWTNHSFTAAAPGWRLAYHDNGYGFNYADLPGWLTQLSEREVGRRRIVAADVDTNGELVPASTARNFCRALAPSDLIGETTHCARRCRANGRTVLAPTITSTKGQ